MAGLKHFFYDPIILIWIIVLVILVPILKPGFFSFHDETHIVDVYQMIRSMEVGGFPPRFAPDFNFSLGHPYFNFYYHLPFYITSVFYYAGFSMTDSYKYMLGLAVVLSAGGFYLFLRNHVSKLSAVLATLVYILSPYYAVDLYVRGSPGEMYIFALFPWAGYLLHNYLTKSSSKNLALAAVPVFLISISHNVLLPFVYALLFLYGAINILILKKKFVDYLKLFLPFIIGLILGTYYLLPALTEVKFISNYEQFNIVDHFPFIKQLLIPHWGYGPSIWGYLDDISFNIGTVNLILLAFSFIVYQFAKREIRILLIFFWIIFGIAIVLMNIRTLFFWESIRFLRLVQFPWRMLLLTTISTAFISGLTIEVISKKFKKASLFFLIIVFSLLLGLNLWHYQPSQYKEVSDEKYLELYFANRTLGGNGERDYLSSEYLNFTEDFIPPTVWQRKRPDKLLDEIKLASDSGQVSFSRKGLSYDISYKTYEDDKVIIARTYFPGWEAVGPSGKLNIEAYSEYGVIAIPVMKGEGQFNLSFKNTPIRTGANLISAAGSLLLLLLLVYPAIKKIKHD